MLLSRSYRPSLGLAPYIRRYYVFEAELPGDMVIEDLLLAETAFVRCLLKGEWQGEVAPGNWSHPDKMLFFGANEKPFKVLVQGSFKVAGFAPAPAAGTRYLPVRTAITQTSCYPYEASGARWPTNSNPNL
jgi:hypothetical protein